MITFASWITPLYAGLIGLILLWLSFGVVRQRLKHKVLLGDGGVAELNQAIRAQANLIEYAPTALILLACLEAEKFSLFVVHGLGILLVVARILHGIGLRGSSGPSAGRGLGAMLTWIMILIAAILAILGSVSTVRL